MPEREAEAARRRLLGYRLRQAAQEWRSGLIAAGLLAAVLALLGLAGARSAADASRRAFADLPGVMQRVAAERYCTVGHGVLAALPTVETDARSTPAAPAAGGPRPAFALSETGAPIAVVARALPEPGEQEIDKSGGPPPSPNYHEPMNLVRFHPPWGIGWRSRTEVLPQQVGFELAGSQPLFAPSPRERSYVR